MIPVKICGLTSAADAQMAAEMGAAAVGMVFYAGSSRCVTAAQAQAIVAGLDRRVARVGVFVNESPNRINAIVAEVGLDLVQLSADEPPEDCARVDVPVIKALQVSPEFDPARANDYAVRAVLLDTFKDGSFGGTGQTFTWNAIDRQAIAPPVILAGGLHPGNVRTGIAQVEPDAVDINSGVEAAPGRKDRAKLAALFAMLKDTKGTDAVVF
ncbi:MAG: phosphoribosylanthranilate isomerase [Candidatus Neomarinimicrobiota bacterium]